MRFAVARPLVMGYHWKVFSRNSSANCGGGLQLPYQFSLCLCVYWCTVLQYVHCNLSLLDKHIFICLSPSICNIVLRRTISSQNVSKGKTRTLGKPEKSTKITSRFTDHIEELCFNDFFNCKRSEFTFFELIINY